MFEHLTLTHPVLAVSFTAAVLLCLSMLFIRFCKGPTPLDRLTAFEGMALVFVCLVGVWGAAMGTLWFFDIVLVMSLVGFLSTIAVAVYIERRPE